MSVHEYSAQSAYELLMRKLQEKDATLAARVQAAVDTGKDVDETESLSTGRKRSRIYRKTAPYTYDEALQVALNALAAYFVEQPLFLNSFLDNMAPAILEAPHRPNDSSRIVKKQLLAVSLETKGSEKRTEIELRTETQISEAAEETFALHRLPPDQVQAQVANLDRVRKFATFENQ